MHLAQPITLCHKLAGVYEEASRVMGCSPLPSSSTETCSCKTPLGFLLGSGGKLSFGQLRQPNITLSGGTTKVGLLGGYFTPAQAFASCASDFFTSSLQ